MKIVYDIRMIVYDRVKNSIWYNNKDSIKNVKGML